MSAGAAVIVPWAIFGAIPGVLLVHGAISLIRRCPQLGALGPAEPAFWPLLSVVIPARDEADTIEPALASLLAQDYPALEVVLVDDRSGDGTGEIIDRLAASDARISPLHVRELPAGWLGKVHALERGVERARGTFVLFTDADIRFAQGVLRRAVAWAEEQRFDHVTVLAEVRQRSFWAGICVAAAMRGILALARPWEATDPRSPKAIGTGAFNLVRRAAFERTPGFEWLPEAARCASPASQVGRQVGLLLERPYPLAEGLQLLPARAASRLKGSGRKPPNTFVPG